MSKKGKVVLAYSGGLDTSVCIAWLKDQGYDVVTLSLEIGQKAELAKAKERALQIGASNAYVLDLRQEFVDKFVWPSLKANAKYQGTYVLNSALSRPLIAQALVWAAEAEGAVAVAHGCTGKGQDQVRIEVCAKTLNPQLEVLAPVRDWGMTREAEMDYAKEKNVPVPTTKESPYSIDENLWGRSIECGVIENPWNQCPEGAYTLTVSPHDAPDKPVTVEITFEKGIPVALDGKKMPAVDLIQELNKIGGAAGVGRVDMLEDRLVGFKSREIYECPAAEILISAHKALESMTLTKDVLKHKKTLEPLYAEITYEGMWFSPLKEALDAFIDVTQQTVSGVVRVELYKGQAVVNGMKSDQTIYRHDLATYSEGDTFDQSAATGFMKIWGLPVKTWREAHPEKNENPIAKSAYKQQQGAA